MDSVVFVNTYNAPSVGPEEARRRRGHVTRTNFANRRQRRAKQLLQEALGPPGACSCVDTITSRDSSSDQEDQAPALVTANKEDHRVDLWAYPSASELDLSVRYLFHEFRHVLFAVGNGPRASENGKQWTELFLSEPALVEATMAVSSGYYPRGVDKRKADLHTYRAIRLVNQRLDNLDTSIQDGVLAAVFTLGFREKLSNNKAAKLAHYNGLTQMIRLRRNHTKKELPAWFSDIIIYETVSDCVAYTPPNGMSVAVLSKRHLQTVQVLSEISATLGLLTEPVHAYRKDVSADDETWLSIQRQINHLHGMLDPLAEYEGVHVASMVRATRIFLHLLWPPQENVGLNHLASDLRASMLRPSVRLCISMQMSTWQLFVGCIAAENGSELREWFIGKLELILRMVDFRTWDEVRAVIEMALPIGEKVVEPYFRSVWDEISSQWGKNEQGVTGD